MTRKPLQARSDQELEKAKDHIEALERFVGEMSKQVPGPGWASVIDMLGKNQEEIDEELNRRMNPTPQDCFQEALTSLRNDGIYWTPFYTRSQGKELAELLGDECQIIVEPKSVQWAPVLIGKSWNGSLDWLEQHGEERNRLSDSGVSFKDLPSKP